MEIERKFLVKYLPDLSNCKSYEIEQLYLSYNPEIRIRKKNDKYFLTCKSDDNLIRQETEFEITEEQYNSLKDSSNHNILYKTRYEFLENNYKYEIDIYKNENIQDIVEIEFNSETEANNFIKPEWIGDEVTYISEFKNKNLDLCGFPKELKCTECNGEGYVNYDYGY